MDKPTEFFNYLDKREFDFVRSLLAKEEIENIFSKLVRPTLMVVDFITKLLLMKKIVIKRS
jgi:hypothetical protein